MGIEIMMVIFDGAKMHELKDTYEALACKIGDEV